MNRKKLEKELDIAYAYLIKQRGSCVKCGSKDRLETAHIISRQNHCIRWDVDNGLCMCHDCHLWAHREPIFFREFAKNTLGDLKYETLYQRSLAIRIWQKEEMLTYLAALKKQIKLELRRDVYVGV